MVAQPGPGEIDALVRLVQGGERKAFTELFMILQQEVRVFISAHASSPDMVDEVLQATFVACYQSIRCYEPRGTFLSWLKGIARNLLLKELRERAKYAAVRGDVLEQIVQGSSLRSLEADEAGPAEKLQGCLEKLPPHSRELLQERYAGRRSVADLARSQGKSPSWLAVTLFRIREALRACLAGGEPAHDR